MVLPFGVELRGVDIPFDGVWVAEFHIPLVLCGVCSPLISPFRVSSFPIEEEPTAEVTLPGRGEADRDGLTEGAFELTSEIALSVD